MDTLHAARQGALPRQGNEDVLKRAASNLKPGTEEREIFKQARLNAEFNRNKLGKLGGKSRRRNKKGKKKTNKKHRN